MKKKVHLLSASVMTAALVLSACGGAKEAAVIDGSKPYSLKYVVNQVGEIPTKGNGIEKAIMESRTPILISSGFQPLLMMKK